VGMVLTVGDNVGVLFSGFRVHLQKRKCMLLKMKNSRKKGGWCSLLVNIRVLFPGSMAHFQKIESVLLPMKNSNKIAENAEKKVRMVLTVGNDVGDTGW
jgi:hypothetical protein